MRRPAGWSLDHHGDSVTVATRRGVVLVAWHRMASPVAVVWLGEQLLARHERDGLPTGVLTIPKPGLGAPEPEARLAFRELVAKTRSAFSAHAVVWAASGIAGGLTRTLLRTTGVLLRPKYPQRIFATVDEAAAWLCEDGRIQGLTSADLVSIAHTIQAPPSTPREGNRGSAASTP